ncbi:MAG: twin-arginine translocase TatA/TatE family subunit [Planctomycetales bacterium]|nr:twin-arginine translocase TatA/TatE family subunit [bacterium]UNM10083.1 MAG: twin-arginine translocase TatA/TatE family subunit [Planctomycetales bacterium]
MWVPGGQELIIILIVVLILFGGTKLPQLMRGMGTGIKEFKQAIKDDDDKQADDKPENDKK